ncbi:hypothetical protein A2422_02200 [Candidatus Woesebacteria bacterium RIFOXYC1_FULL_31_51]|uniref:Glycosyl transferase group 1 n=1 Tax=Candidatus Woesebacteria bacterium GW2011_GWC2_31_9 TaxID=1618586 RepID=A0A0F9YHI5_9BACT|nr:MAG: Glycosyl transferase, group 1 [Candidatus Woesebacteria bacterium GW2011_GWF1_31_35]KKP23558.1 MAG: Glycosyl transferase group 1 [Candidatus Woesebacteria bacterium GW2011_GWC1_30_29]KKP27834.1 MAG: Glycosyl transferase group 1 [Candidatus Woesebacteria bacterium GW2011_GWB1_31_29]KKP31054.1 MAG: Glycosyl transferase group 1 [Candidatus Woesebacteria bacterium GW2011_GWC2_31_9]KKP34126.1 MAG: Glycosyl transferase group 1 [Candidatus Woesebacteria bacterium GW2011_GWF2_32_16]KKP34492.1 
MKILLDCRFYGLENGGLGRYTINLLNNLSSIDKNNEYTVLLRKKYFEELSFPKNFKKILVDLKPYSFLEQITIPFIIFKEKPDLSHFLHFNAPLLTPKPYVVTIHDMIMHKSKGLETTTLNPIYYLIKRFVYKFVFKNALINSNKIIVPSETVKDELNDFFKLDLEKIKVSYLGLDYKILKPNLQSITKKYFVYVGNAYPHKNLTKLIDAIGLSKVTLKISTSKNSFSKNLINIIKEKKLEKYVKVLGFLDDLEIVKLYQDSVGFIYPSLIEGFGFQGLEALSSGTLLLASNIPVFKEVYKNNAIYFDPNSSDSIANAINEALKINSLKRLQMIQDGQKFILKYSWEKTTLETIKIYESIR